MEANLQALFEAVKRSDIEVFEIVDVRRSPSKCLPNTKREAS
ncbi:hypothetical protein NTE_00249 [Candidatus Nitrososphaera evergladensis SR1]|uniref:Uncharacterized protein n=1 Tax=Candidatus Nitrososphaera evergladensis SR1 TaxID=1459636 RepID=A0A075MLJ2_9ARCH|nr:hypothetical protein NTE_00249 [Candidatus Nitrososphaera evergladensis SR1]